MILPYLKLAQAYSNKHTKSLGKTARAPVKCLKTRRKMSLLLWDSAAAQFHCHDTDCFARCIQKSTQTFKRPSVFRLSLLQEVEWGVWKYVGEKRSAHHRSLLHLRQHRAPSTPLSHGSHSAPSRALKCIFPPLHRQDFKKNKIIPLNRRAQTGTDQVILQAAPP